VLGTDGYGLSEDRHVLREYFEVSAEWITFAALSTLAQNDRLDRDIAMAFADRAELDLQKPDPACA
jgi:pyruvate dehydrogenase complex dehydrogenase (E1) component